MAKTINAKKTSKPRATASTAGGRERAALRTRVLDAIPTSWVDSLLIGPRGIGQPPYDCRHIEKLLRGVRNAVIAAFDAEGK